MSTIGLWMARYGYQHRDEPAHFVESEIANRRVMRCGRELQDADAHGDVLGPAETDRPHCKQCAGKGAS